MTHTKTFTYTAAVMTAVLLLFASFSFAHAAPPAACVGITVASTTDEWKACGTARIDVRNTSMAALNTRVQGMKYVSIDVKTSLMNSIAAQLLNLATLKNELTATTTQYGARTLSRSVLVDYRIYALYIPQGHLTAAADSIKGVAGILTTISADLKTKIDAAEVAGKPVSNLRILLADMDARIASMTTKSTNALAEIVNLVPDHGDKNVIASNAQALTDARVLLTSARADIVIARSDAFSLRDKLATL